MKRYIRSSNLKARLVAHLQERIIAVVTDIDRNMLLNKWTELDYSWDVCRVIMDAHIEHL